MKVSIETPGQTISDCIIPDGYTPENIISALLEERLLPYMDHGGHAIAYSLLHVGSNLILPDKKTLAEAGVEDGDTLQVVRADRMRFGKRLPKGGVEVFLTVLDLNRTQRVKLLRKATTAEIIRTIVDDYDLPTRNKFGEVIIYRLESKARDRFLRNTETMHQAGIPYLDSLSLHREEAARGETIIPFKRRPVRRLSRLMRGVVSKYRRLRSGRRTTPVECTVYAPPSVPQGEMCFVQVFAYDPLDRKLVSKMAKEFDRDAARRGYTSLETEVAYGSTLTFHLTIPGIPVEDSIQRIIWHGNPRVVPFAVTVPEGRRPGDLIATVRIAADQVPLGHIKFKLTVVKAEQAVARPEAVGEGRAYRKAFISYARQDFNEVLKRVQMLPKLRIKFFQDVLSLNAGERWEAKLRRHISESDLFLLFWSDTASRSEWVLDEIRYALEVKRGDDRSPPEIIPIPIEGPPPVPPPPELAHMHFDDYFLYLQLTDKAYESTDFTRRL